MNNTTQENRNETNNETKNEKENTMKMSFEIEVLTADLKRVIENAQKVIDKRSTIPVLTHVHLKYDNGSLQVTATDLGIEYQENIQR